MTSPQKICRSGFRKKVTLFSVWSNKLLSCLFSFFKNIKDSGHFSLLTLLSFKIYIPGAHINKTVSQKAQIENSKLVLKPENKH